MRKKSIKAIKKSQLNIRKIVIMIILTGLFSISFIACDPKDEEASEEQGGEETAAADAGADQDYEDYIHDALAAVRDNATVSTGNSNNTEVPEDDSTGRVVYVEKQDSPDNPESVFVSSSDDDLNDVFEDPADETKGQKDADSDANIDKTTPAVFDVGTGLVYIDGNYDPAYQANLQTLINSARTGLNYLPFTINNSLGTCANLRAKEITCYLSHYRPDGSAYNSLAPDYYKAEIITVSGASEKDVLDAWLMDPVSKNLIFSKEYTNIGVSTYVCNGLNCTVVSFGY